MADSHITLFISIYSASFRLKYRIIQKVDGIKLQTDFKLQGRRAKAGPG